MSYQRVRSGMRKAVGDYGTLINELEQAYSNKSMQAAREAGAQFFNTTTGQTSAVAAPLLGAAAGIGMIDAQQGDVEPVSGFIGMHAGVPYAAGAAVASAVAAPVVGRMLDRNNIDLSEAEQRQLLNKLAQMDAEIKQGTDAYEAYEKVMQNGGGSEAMRPEMSREQLQDRRGQADRLRNGQVKEATQKLDQLRGRARTRGGALTAAGLGLLGLTGAMVNRSPQVEAAAIRGSDPFLEPHGWSAINGSERMKDWAAGRLDDDMDSFPYY